MTRGRQADEPDDRPPFEPADDADTPAAERPGADPAPGGKSTPGAHRSGDPAPAEGRGEVSFGTRVYRAVREIVIVVVIALLASSLLRAFVVQAFFVPSTSMLPTIHRSDRILVSRINDVERGEVVVFEDPGGWITGSEQTDPPGGLRRVFEWVGVLPSSSHEHLVKRVIGLPGDHVVCCDAQGRLSVNGADIDESGTIAPGDRRADDSRYDLIVPAGHYFVLGDNRYESADSAYHLQIDNRDDPNSPFVPEELVTGRAFSIVWPLGDAGWLGIPDSYDQVPAGQSPPRTAVIRRPRGFDG